MDVEKTIEFILQMQAQAEVRGAKLDERMDRAESRLEQAESRMEKNDRRTAQLQRILIMAIRAGNRHINRLDGKMNALIDQHMRLEERMDETNRILRSMLDSRNKPNGQE